MRKLTILIFLKVFLITLSSPRTLWCCFDPPMSCYSVRITESLEGTCLLMHDRGSVSAEFTIMEVLSGSVTDHYGICVGDTLLTLNGQPFADVASSNSGKFTDPTSILWCTQLPYTLTLSRHKGNVHVQSDVVDGDHGLSDDDKFHPQSDADNEPSDDCTFTPEIMSTVPQSVMEPMPLFRPMIMDESITNSGSTSLIITESTSLVINSPILCVPMRSMSPISSISLRGDHDHDHDGHSSLDLKSSSSTSHDSSEYTDSTQSNRCNLTQNKLIQRHLVQGNSMNLSVVFDTASMTKSNGKVLAVSSHPLRTGIHEWTVEIMKCDVDIQEIGVCSVCDIEGIPIHDDGVTETVQLGARGLYGNELASNMRWYASFNENGTRRCFKDLTPHHHIGWTVKDTIRVVVNLDKWRIKFYHNGKRVRKVLSLQRLKANEAYYPFISFAGNCQYYLY